MELRLEHVTKRFGNRTVLDLPELVIRSGELFCVVGPSGAGKTTLLRLIAGVETPSSGTVWGNTRALNDVPPGDRDIALLASDRALAESGTSVCLLDDPLTEHAPADRAARRVALQERYRGTGTTVVLATEEQRDALDLADRIAVLKDGRLHQVGAPSDILERPATTFVASFFGTPPMNVVPGILEKDGVAVDIGPRSVQLNGTVERTYARDVFLGIRPEHVKLGPGSMPGWRGKVSAVEPLSDGVAVRVAVDMGAFVSCQDGTTPYHVGDAVTLILPAKHLYVFDERGGRLNVI